MRILKSNIVQVPMLRLTSGLNRLVNVFDEKRHVVWGPL